MKGQFEYGSAETPDDDHNIEIWTDEMFKKRSEELHLLDMHGNMCVREESLRNISRCEDIALSDLDQSPSRSTTTESQVNNLKCYSFNDCNHEY